MTPSEILLELLQGEDGKTWSKQREGWEKGTDACEWEGIECDDQGSVTEINLQGTRLVATIPDSLARLTSLRHIFLSDNELHGTVSSFAINLPKLVQIDLSSNKLRGSVPKLTGSDLEVINFSRNQFSGKLAKNFGVGLANVRILDLEKNRIGGMLPQSLGDMVGLEVLNLSNNRFAGPIPNDFDKLHSLEGLFLHNNKLIGPIPISLTQKYLALKQLYLHGNRLSGTVPLALSDLPHLKDLFIDGNKITGTVPEELCAKNLNEAFFGVDVKIVDSDVDDAFTDDDPELDVDDDFYRENPEFLEDDIYNTDMIPDKNSGRKVLSTKATHTKSRAGQRQLSGISERDGCNSIACPAGTRSTSEGSKDGIYPCVECEHDHLNPYLGAKQCFELDHDKILQQFYYSTYGENWGSGGETWIDENVPLCEKKGITCTSGGDVSEIRLSGMNLSGSISEDLGFLRHLEVLDLSNNFLYGNLPSSLEFLPLEVLDVSGNMLTGFVPPELCNKYGINGNGENGDLNCDVIACRAGTYSPIGRAEVAGDQCLSCEGIGESSFLGSRDCSTPVNTKMGNNSVGRGVGSFFIILSAMFCGLFVFVKTKRTYVGHHINDGSHCGASGGTETSEADELMSEDPMQAGLFPGFEEKHETKWNSKKEESKEVWLDVPKIHG